jgi:hypothetical protein
VKIADVLVSKVSGWILLESERETLDRGRGVIIADVWVSKVSGWILLESERETLDRGEGGGGGGGEEGSAHTPTTPHTVSRTCAHASVPRARTALAPPPGPPLHGVPPSRRLAVATQSRRRAGALDAACATPHTPRAPALALSLLSPRCGTVAPPFGCAR